MTLSIELPERESLDTDSLPTGVTPVEVAVPGGAGRIRVRATLKLEDPKRWNPVGHGDPDEPFPTLYAIDFRLAGDDPKTIVDERSAKIGLRTVELIREPDPEGSGESFKFRVNGDDLFAKGANWIPVGSFPSQFPTGDHDEDMVESEDSDEPDPIEHLLFLAHRAGMNMMRVWGGGLYESERFYDLCDAFGLLVWQDFPYACAYYPDTGDYAEAGRREAVAATRRLRIHPSLALWCGNNENSQMFRDGWSGKRPPRLLGEKLYLEILPEVVESEDPGRPYWPSSPYGGDNPNDPNVGDRHDWDVWHGVGDWIHYPEDDSRFVSEFGFASSCGMAAWDGCLSDEDKEPRSAAVRWHDKTRKGYETYLGYIALHHPEPQTLEDLAYYSQINQAEALKCGIEHWRRRKGRCWGTLFWQLNDCWPVQSWSVIDWLGEPKAAYYAAERFYAPVLLSMVRNGTTVEAHLTNDRLQEIGGTVVLTLKTFEGEPLETVVKQAHAGKNGTAVVATIDISASIDREREVFVHAEYTSDEPDSNDDFDNCLFVAEPKDFRLSKSAVDIEVVSRDDESFLVTLKANRFAPYVWLRLEGPPEEAGRIEWSDNFLHLHAGELREVILYPATLTESAAEIGARIRVRAM